MVLLSSNTTRRDNPQSVLVGVGDTRHTRNAPVRPFPADGLCPYVVGVLCDAPSTGPVRLVKLCLRTSRTTLTTPCAPEPWAPPRAARAPALGSEDSRSDEIRRPGTGTPRRCRRDVGESVRVGADLRGVLRPSGRVSPDETHQAGCVSRARIVLTGDRRLSWSPTRPTSVHGTFRTGTGPGPQSHVCHWSPSPSRRPSEMNSSPDFEGDVHTLGSLRGGSTSDGRCPTLWERGPRIHRGPSRSPGGGTSPSRDSQTPRTGPGVATQLRPPEARAVPRTDIGTVVGSRLP